jgi:hypothetical protein
MCDCFLHFPVSVLASRVTIRHAKGKNMKVYIYIFILYLGIMSSGRFIQVRPIYWTGDWETGWTERLNIHIYVGFEVLTAVVINVAIFWDIVPSSRYLNRHFFIKQ